MSSCNLPLRSLDSRALPTVGSAGVERHLSGWYVITAESDDIYLFPNEGQSDWDYLQVGIFVQDGDSILRYFEDTELGYYTARGKVRLERVEFVDPKEVSK